MLILEIRARLILWDGGSIILYEKDRGRKLRNVNSYVLS